MVNEEQAKAEQDAATEEQQNTSHETEGAEAQQTAAEAAEDAGEAAAEAAEDILEAEHTLESLQEELAAAKDAALRSQAEAQNARRRSEQEVEKARKFALERFSGDLLPVVDNLERALEAAGGDSDEVKAIAEGVDLTLKGLIDALGKHHVEQVDPAGEPFDPQVHQAMTMLENPDCEPNTVLHVMQKGYTLNGRLIRPAMVTVSKAPEEGK